MSRGRGRGRGGGGGNATRDAFNAAFAGMSKEDSRALFESFSRPTKGSGMMYPPVEKPAELPGPTLLEEKIVKQALVLARDLADGPAGEHGRRTSAPWRLASERKVVGVEIEAYSDRYKRQQPESSGSSVLDARALRLNQGLAPPALWKEYFDGVKADALAGASTAERARKRRRMLDDDDEGKEDEEEGEEDDVDDDFDFSEGEEDHQDYDHNYFDNGEGDDDDSGGEGGEDDGGRYED